MYTTFPYYSKYNNYQISKHLEHNSESKFLDSYEIFQTNSFKGYYENLDYIGNKSKIKWAATWDFQQCGMCDQQRLRPVCAYAQSDQSLR